jgi:type I restriction enzyme M protein
MLETKIKKIIDSSRNTLVSKFPDPMAQIEQISYALILKYLFDLDNWSVKNGGKPSFYTGKYEKYSWEILISKSVTGLELFNLYQNALIDFNSNEKIDKSLRDLFQEANVKTLSESPEVLKRLLKEINQFEYELESLGTPYEYLLSKMKTQGDLGQFRTPRHIIEFITEIVKPTKKDVILDPSCGTAGFLVQAYKYIEKKNTKRKPGDLLTHIDKKNIRNNLIGYDIEPRMVKFAKVLLYFNNVTKSNIHEYDTLTQDSRWNENADVVMANPPFMTPKGGIAPHNKFSIKTSRAEPLFVDYIIEHLNTNGRGAIIIPEGITSNKNAFFYTELRKKLIDSKFLYAVCELHEGVFKPYGDVKTHIFFLDKRVGSKVDSILFLNVANDGFKKGDKKDVIEDNDIPEITKILNSYQDKFILNKEINLKNFTTSKSHLVKLSTIKKDDLYILRGKHYEIGFLTTEKLETLNMKNVIEETNIKNKEINSNIFSVSNEKGLISSQDYFTDSVHSKDLSKYKLVSHKHFVFNPSRLNVGSIGMNDTFKEGCVSSAYKVFKIINKKILPEFLFNFIKSKEFVRNLKLSAAGTSRRSIDIDDLKKFKIPILSTEIQNKIAKYHTLSKHLEIINNKYEHHVSIENKILKKCKLSDLFHIEQGDKQSSKIKSGKYKFVSTAEEMKTSDSYRFEGEAILVPCVSMTGHGKATISNIYYINDKFDAANMLMVLRPKNKKVNTKFYYFFFKQEKNTFFTKLMNGTSNVTYNPIDDASNILIPFIDEKYQKDLADELSFEEKIINQNKEIIKNNNKKIDLIINNLFK